MHRCSHCAVQLVLLGPPCQCVNIIVGFSVVLVGLDKSLKDDETVLTSSLYCDNYQPHLGTLLGIFFEHTNTHTHTHPHTLTHTLLTHSLNTLTHTHTHTHTHTSGQEGIAAGTFLPKIPCLLHGKLTSVNLDLRVRTPSSLLTDSLAKLVEQVFK